MCKEYIWNRARPGQTVIVSDETLTEQPEVYYTPHMMPTIDIAKRLRTYFPKAKVIFTIRDQYRYVVSSYFNVKRNYAQLSLRPIEEFGAWFEGNHSQVSNLFLRNLDYSAVIKDYIKVFGRDAISVLPLELVEREGDVHYLHRLSEALGIEISSSDIARFSDVRNKRMTFLEDAAVTRWADPGFRRTYELLTAQIGSDAMAAAMRKSAPVDLPLTASQREVIRQRAGRGNHFIARQFSIPLENWGYPVITEERQLPFSLRRRIVPAFRRRLARLRSAFQEQTRRTGL